MDSLGSVTYIILAEIIVLIGSMVQGSIGIGLGFVAVPLLVLIDPNYVPGPLLMAALLLTILIAWRDHHAVRFTNVTWAISGRALGTLFGVIVITLIPVDKMSLLFAGMIVLAVLVSVLGLRLHINRKNLFGTGLLSGIMGTTAAIGGVPMAIIYQDLAGPSLRGTLSSIFTIGTIISILALVIIGKFGWNELQLAGVLTPGIIIGFLISTKLTNLLDRGLVRPVLLWIAVLAACGIIIRYYF